MPLGGDLPHAEDVPLGHRRQLTLLVVVGVRLGALLDVRQTETGVGDHGAAGTELGVASRRKRSPHTNAHRLTGGVDHLGRNGSLPHQPVHRGHVGVHESFHLVGVTELLPGGPDRLMGLLGVLDLLGVHPRFRGKVLRAVAGHDLVARRGEGGCRQRRRVGSHVGDEALLVQRLCGPHGPLGAVAEFRTGFLLQRRRDERSSRATAVRLALHGTHRHRRNPEFVGDRGRSRLVEHHGAGLGRTRRVEVPSGGDPGPVERNQCRGERPLVTVGATEFRLDAPVPGGDERHAFPLAVNDDADRHALHPTGRGAMAHDTSHHRGDVPAVETVEDPAGLLGVDETSVDLTGVGDRLGDGRRGDFVEHHALDGHVGRRVEHLEQVPGNGLALTILIGGEEQLVGVTHQTFEFGHLLFLLGGHHVHRFEPVEHVDAVTGPRFVLVGLRKF